MLRCQAAGAAVLRSQRSPSASRSIAGAAGSPARSRASTSSSNGRGSDEAEACGIRGGVAT